MGESIRNKFDFNPFSGVLEADIAEALVPKFDLSKIRSKIENSESLAIEFVGRKGRGKTTHLTCLQQSLPAYPIFYLNSNSKLTEIIHHPSKIVFIDSIHHLNLMERVKLFKTKILNLNIGAKFLFQ